MHLLNMSPHALNALLKGIVLAELGMSLTSDAVLFAGIHRLSLHQQFLLTPGEGL